MCGDLDPRTVVTVGGGVFQDVQDRLLQQGPVQLHPRQVGGEIARDPPPAGPLADPRQGRRDHLPYIDPFPFRGQRPGLQSGHVEQVADVTIQALRLLPDALEQVAPHGGRQLVAIVQQGGGGPQNGRQRRAEIVTDRVEQGRA